MTTNLRICANNLVEGGALLTSLAATTEVSTLPASNLRNSNKSLPWRSTSIASEQFITIVFTVAQPISMLAAMFTNLSASATIKAYLYTLSGDGSPVYTSAATPVFNSYLTGQALAATKNVYAAGAGSQAVVYFPEHTVQKVVLGITDTSNSAGYLQVGNLVAGKYWSTVLNFARGASIQFEDDGKMQRAHSGDPIFEQGTRRRKIAISLSQMGEADRLQCTTLLRTLGTTHPLFISLFPNNTDATLETLYMLQGSIESMQPLTNTQFARYSIPFTILEL